MPDRTRRSRSVPRLRRQGHKNSFDEMIEERHGYSPELWGRSHWRFLHYASLVYFPKDKFHWEVFLTRIFPKMIPCKTCQIEYCRVIKANRQNLDYHLQSRKNLVKFLISLHNSVNQRVKKNYKPFTCAKFVAVYNK